MNRSIYVVSAEYFWGDGSEEKRAAQLAILEEHGLKEFEERRVLCTAEQALALFNAGYCGDYLGTENIKLATEMDAGPDVEQLFSILSCKIASLSQQSFNERCQQQQPNLALLGVNETLLLENSCTDNLQSHLAQGWRILAVQPQPDQRRPDYILGRSSLSAMRG